MFSVGQESRPLQVGETTMLCCVGCDSRATMYFKKQNVIHGSSTIAGSGKIVVTSDKDFMKSFPHMAAISLGNTTVLAFTSNNYNSEIRGKAFIKAQGKIFRAIRQSNGVGFIGSVGMDGSFSIVERSPTPTKKYCDERDWKSYERVCASEGVKYEKPVTSAASVQGE
jgi:hypothetical protein